LSEGKTNIKGWLMYSLMWQSLWNNRGYWSISDKIRVGAGPQGVVGLMRKKKFTKRWRGVEERVCGNVGVACASLIITLEYQCQLLYAFLQNPSLIIEMNLISYPKHLCLCTWNFALNCKWLSLSCAFFILVANFILMCQTISHIHPSKLC
jgi:hypothetical protein